LITVNGEQREFEGTVAELVAAVDAPDRGVAVAVDAEVVPKSEWDTHAVEDGAHVEIVVAVQGG
jgi:sulfur carrier protein